MRRYLLLFSLFLIACSGFGSWPVYLAAMGLLLSLLALGTWKADRRAFISCLLVAAAILWGTVPHLFHQPPGSPSVRYRPEDRGCSHPLLPFFPPPESIHCIGPLDHLPLAGRYPLHYRRASCRETTSDRKNTTHLGHIPGLWTGPPGSNGIFLAALSRQCSSGRPGLPDRIRHRKNHRTKRDRPAHLQQPDSAANQPDRNPSIWTRRPHSLG